MSDSEDNLRTCGGTVDADPSSVHFDRWIGKADNNIAEWGTQHPLEILSAINEEVGEIEQAYLEATHEESPPDRVEEEIDDLGPLLMQLLESIHKHPMAFEPLPTAEEVDR